MLTFLKQFLAVVFSAPKAEVVRVPIPHISALDPTPTGPTSQGGSSSFWKSSITAQFRPGVRELVIYFCVSRSASRAQQIQQMVLAQPALQEAECKAEILRLVGWEFDKPHVTVEVTSLANKLWRCRQVNETGIREPFGYIVLSSVYAPGLVSSFTVAREDLKDNSVRFQLSDNSAITRLK